MEDVKSFLPAALLLLACVLGILVSGRLVTRAQNTYLNSWVYQEAVETTSAAPSRILAIVLQHPVAMCPIQAPASTSTGPVYPIKVFVNGSLLPAQPTKSWGLSTSGLQIVIVMPATPPVDFAAFPGAAPTVRVDVDYWWGQ